MAMKQTQKSLLTAGIFLVLAVGVAFVAAWVKHDEELKVEAKEKAEKIFAFDKAKVRSVKLEKHGMLVAEATREDAGKPWVLVAPVKTDADQVQVNGIVEKLAELKQKSELGADVDPKQSGLDILNYKITLGLDDKSTQELDVGADNSFDNTTYVRKASDKTVRLIDGFHKSAWDKSPFDLRDKRVLKLADNEELKAFTIVNDEPYTLRKEGAEWKLTGPGHETPELADSGTADRIVTALKNLKATAVATETADAKAMKDYGLDDPKVVVEWEGRKVSIGQASGKTYAQRSDAPAVLELDGQIVKDLDKRWFDLQDKTVAKFDREQVRTLQIEAPGAAPIAVARKKESKDGGVADEVFTVEAPASGSAKRWKISSALYTLSGLKAVAFAGAAPKDAKGKAAMGLDKPRTYTVLGDAGKVLAKIHFGGPVQKEDKRLYAWVDGAPRVVEVEKATVNDLPQKLDDVLEPPPAPAQAPDGGTVQASVPK